MADDQSWQANDFLVSVFVFFGRRYNPRSCYNCRYLRYYYFFTIQVLYYILFFCLNNRNDNYSDQCPHWTGCPLYGGGRKWRIFELMRPLMQCEVLIRRVMAMWLLLCIALIIIEMFFGNCLGNGGVGIIYFFFFLLWGFYQLFFYCAGVFLLFFLQPVISYDDGPTIRPAFYVRYCE